MSNETRRIDGSKAPGGLLERLSLEDDGLLPSTISRYTRLIERQQAEITAKFGALSAPNLARHLEGQIAAGLISQATARLYRAAALFWIAENARPLLNSGRDFSQQESAFDQIAHLDLRGLPKRTERTSSPKTKHFREELIDRIIRDSDSGRQSKYLARLVAFLRANLLVGLRPAEWFSARSSNYALRDAQGRALMREGKQVQVPSLLVMNAKHTHGRANGAVRELLLHGAEIEQLATLKHFMEMVEDYQEGLEEGADTVEAIEEFYRPIRKLLRAKLRKLAPDATELSAIYSTRHQAVANAKASGMTANEIAAFFGHASVHTAKRHYGKKFDGRGSMSFRPSIESIRAVARPELAGRTPLPGQEAIQKAEQWKLGEPTEPSK